MQELAHFGGSSCYAQTKPKFGWFCTQDVFADIKEATSR
jgi:hypothetical protein